MCFVTYVTTIAVTFLYVKYVSGEADFYGKYLSELMFMLYENLWETTLMCRKCLPKPSQKYIKRTCQLASLVSQAVKIGIFKDQTNGLTEQNGWIVWPYNLIYPL